MHDRLVRAEEKKGNDVYKKVTAPETTKRSAKQSLWTQLRIKFRTDYIMNDVLQRTCYKVGQAYRAGSPKDTSVVCSSTVVDDCWGTCTSTVTQSIEEKLDSLLMQVQTIFNQMLKTRMFNGVIKLPSDPSATCGANGGVPYPSDLVNDGFPSSTGDIIIFVTLRPSTNTGVLGWGLACLYESMYGRPIMGQFNADPETFFAASEGQQIGIMLHEITHVLGFSESRFSAMIDQNGNQRPGSVLSAYRSYKDSAGNVNTKQVFYLNTPSLIKTAQSYFNCPESLPYGIELEEYGGDGTAGSHFDKRVYNNELMTGNVGWFNPSLSFSISPFTLSFFNDSGWYQSNSSFVNPRSETTLWGRNMGCSFLQNRCEDWDLNNRLGYYCKPNSFVGSTCTYNHRGKGFCSTQQFNQNMGYYEHIQSSPKTGGLDPQLDFCPIVKRYTNGDCALQQLQSNILSGEYWGKGGACFDSNLVPSTSKLIVQDARCFKYDCSSDYLRINAAGSWVDCPKDQSYKRVQLNGDYKGYVDCPVDGYDIICKSNQDVIIDGVPDNSNSCSNVFGWFCTNSSSTRNNAQYAVFAVAFVCLLSMLM
ncbi:leishmanolysin peptidase [Acrasis kona]|uniref:leishmanolysin n=1 Tax=Acrasis kona TaxID=1008807 RepID=A0AAW2YKZ8_9EUKA